MTTDMSPALDLRRKIGDVYLADNPPPGMQRAVWLTAALKREPAHPDHHRMARDLLVVVDLHRRLATLLDRVDDPQLGLVVHGLIGHAAAELMGANDSPGWRAAALDLLEPDGQVRAPLDHDDAARLFALATGPSPDAHDAVH